LGIFLNIISPSVSAKAVSLGGLLLLFHSLYINWSHFDEKHQTVILGMILVALLLFGGKVSTMSFKDIM